MVKSKIINDRQAAIDEFAGSDLSDEKREALIVFMTSFIGDMTPDTGPGVISSGVYWRSNGTTLKLSKEKTSDGYHDLHDSETSVSLKHAVKKEDGWLAFNREMDEKTGSRFKTWNLVKPCKKEFVKNEKVWYKAMGAGFESRAPGSAVFLVYNPPGLTGWYELDYTIYWD